MERKVQFSKATTLLYMKKRLACALTH